MNVKLENIEKNVVQFEIEVEAEKVEEAMQKAFIKSAKKYSIPGFRKGKAPRKMVERFYGESVLYEDTVNIIYPEAFDQAVKDNDVKPVDRPELDIKQIGQGKSLIFTAKVTVMPDVDPGKYKGIEAEIVKTAVTDDDVARELASTAEKNSRLTAVEGRPVQSGDTVIMNYEGSVDGVLFEGGKADNYSLVIGSGRFIPGFEDQIIGMNAGDEKEINVTFPEEYGKKELAGKPAVFKTKVNEIKLKEVPAVDDEFAKEVSEFDTLEEYKASVRKKLVEDAGKKDKDSLERDVVKKVVDGASADIPDVMVERAIDNIVNDFTMRLSYQGLDMNKYLEIIKKDMNSFRADFREEAAFNVKRELVISKITKAEGIEASEQDIEEEVKRYAESYGGKENAEDFRKKLTQEDLDYMKDSIVYKKTAEFLTANAIVTEKTAEQAAAEEKAAAAAGKETAAEAAEAAEAGTKAKAKPKTKAKTKA